MNRGIPCWPFTELQHHPNSPLDVLHDTHAAGVASPGNHAHVSDLELDGVDGLARLQIHLDGVVDLEKWPTPNPQDKRSVLVRMKNLLMKRWFNSSTWRLSHEPRRSQAKPRKALSQAKQKETNT